MMQIEQEKLSGQLKELTNQKEDLGKIDITKNSGEIIKGSLVKTDKGYFFVSVSLGKIQVSNEIIFAISTQSPLGKKLLGLKRTDIATINSVKYSIEEIS